MELSVQAKQELIEILRNEINLDFLKEFSDKDINQLGVRLLHITALLLQNE